MSVNKVNSVLASLLSKFNGVAMSTIAKINGVLLSLGGWNINDGYYNNEYGSIKGREGGAKNIFFKPDGTKMFVAGENSWVSGTAGYLTCGTAAESNYATWEAVTDGSFAVTIDDGQGTDMYHYHDITGIDFTGVTDMAGVATVIQTAIRTATGNLETCVWSTDHFIITSLLTDSQSQVTVLSTIYSGTVGTDISGVGTAWMDGETGVGTATAGTTTAFGGHLLQEFDLAIPWDVSTLRYSHSYDLAANSPYVDDCKGLIFSANGLKIFVSNAWEGTTDANHYYSYTMSTAWDISTISYDSKSYDLSGDGINPHSLSIKADGTKMYASDYGQDGGSTDTNHLVQYTFSTAYDLDTLSKDVAELDTSSECDRINNHYMNADGTRIFVMSKGNITPAKSQIYQYNLSTPYDLSSGSYASKYMEYDDSDLPTYVRSPTGIFVKADGKEMYLLDTYNDRCQKLTIQTAWELDNIYQNNYMYIRDINGDGAGICFNNDGTKLYFNAYNGYIYEMDLTTAYDIRTATYDSVSYNFSGTEANQRALIINDDGSKLYVLGSQTDFVYEIDLSTPYDLSTASYTAGHRFDPSQAGAYPLGVVFGDSGTKMYVNNGNSDIYQYTLSTAWDVTSATYSTKTYNFSGTITGERSCTISLDGTKFYVIDDSNDRICQFAMSTAYDISTCSYSNINFDVNVSVAITENQPRGVTFKPDGKVMYLIGNGTDMIWQINID